MSVYVDASIHRYGRMLMCHLLADTPEELHAMADRIGVARRWYQHSASTPHYDIAKSKRALAVAAGAQQLDRKGIAAVIRRIREAVLSDSPVGHAWILDCRRARAGTLSTQALAAPVPEES